MKPTIERMLADETKDGGRSLSIVFSFVDTAFGRILAAATPRGLCYYGFADDDQAAERRLRAMFPNAAYQKSVTPIPTDRLYVCASDLQFAVWQALLDIPYGQTATYADIARAIGRPKAVRAVGTAIGQNPIAVIIPCHRVIRSDGSIGGYYWGTPVKERLLAYERTAR